MKKMLILIFITLLLIIGFLIYKNYGNNKNVKKNVDVLNNNSKVVESNDLFSKYYDYADKKLKNMSLEEKIGQLFLVRYDKNLAISWTKKYNPGGFILFARDFEGHTKESIKQELFSLQDLASVPLALGVDEEGGYVTRVSRYTNFRESRFLSPREIYEDGGYDLLAKTEKEKAELLLSLGINLNLAPVVDVSYDENDFIYNRSFGRDAKETALFAKNMVSYAKNNNISSCLKHFPGYGNNIDTHDGVAIDNRSYESFLENDFLPFESGIKEGVPVILVSHNIINSIDSNFPATLSKKVISKLRENLHFSGIIITDDLSMGAVNSYVSDGSAAVLAINAGNDMIITSNFEEMYNIVLDAVNRKKIDINDIDTAVRRILAWKKAYNM